MNINRTNYRLERSFLEKNLERKVAYTKRSELLEF